MSCPTCSSSTTTHVSRSFLAGTAEFNDQYKKLWKDRAVGYAGAKFDVPDSFDGPTVWKKYLAPVRNQGGCGSCWAFASSSCLSSRIALATNGKAKPDLSPAAMVFCNLGADFEYQQALKTLAQGQPYDFNFPENRQTRRETEKKQAAQLGCQGETLIGAWQYIFRFAIPEENCIPYEGGYLHGTDLRTFNGEDPLNPACVDIKGDSFDMCPVGKNKPIIYHTISGYYHVPGTSTEIHEVEDVPTPLTSGDEATVAELYAKVKRDAAPDVGSELDIRRDIYHWGPVTSGFTVHDDFMAWDGKTGVYKWDGASAEQGGHAIVIVGWGNEGGTDFWWVQNSWGTEWGINGFFRIERGTNECGIEENVIVGLPNICGYRQYIDRPLLYTPDDLVMRQVWRITPCGAKATLIDSILAGDLPPNIVNVDESIYPSKYWPDLKTFIAGKPDKTRFPLDRSIVTYVLSPRNSEEAFKARMFIGALGAVAIAGGVLWYVSSKKRK